MAINKITAPLSTGPSVFAAPVIAQLAALLTLASNVKRASGGYILKGALFNIGGTMYMADSDTAISGTPSDYVAITASGDIATATYATDVSDVSWNGSYQGCFDTSGVLYIAEDQYGINPVYKKLTSSGIYVVPPNCFELHIKMIGPGTNGSGGTWSTVGKGGASGEELDFKMAVTPLQNIVYTLTTTSTVFGSYTCSAGGGHKGEAGNSSGSGMGYGGAGGGYGGGAYQPTQGRNGNSAIANSGGGGGGAGPSSSTSSTTTGGSGALGNIIIL